jgi:gas vesicle protein
VNDERYDSGSRTAIAFLAGLAVGAGVALLFAPQSGAETRAEIARQAKKARRAAGELATTVRDRASEAYSTTRTAARRRMDEAREGVTHAIDEVRSRVDAGREAGMAGAKAAREDYNRRLADMRSEKEEGNGA